MGRKGAYAVRRSRLAKKKSRREIYPVFLGLVVLICVAFFGTMSLRAKNEVNEKRKQEIMAEIEAEEQRSLEIEELEKEMQTKTYVEEVAKERLGLVYEDEILFKAK